MKEKIKVLLLGRSKCKGTEKIHQKLKYLNFDIQFHASSGRKNKLPEKIYSWEGDFIISFRNLFILPKEILKKAAIAAINFHPGPPEYPGSGCINFALHDEATSYGVTAHIMNDKIDTGQILDVRRFKIEPSDDLKILLDRTHNELFLLCSKFIDKIALKKKDFFGTFKKNHQWQWIGEARMMHELESLKKIRPEITKNELLKIIRATYIKEYPPRIELHGFNFYLKK